MTMPLGGAIVIVFTLTFFWHVLYGLCRYNARTVTVFLEIT